MVQGFWSVGLLMLLGIFALTPLALIWFRPEPRGESPMETVRRVASDYWIHFAFFGVIQALKTLVDSLNDPLRGVFGNFTFVVHRIEGDTAMWIQQAFDHPWLTEVLNFDYIFGFMFISYFSVFLAAYADDRELANKSILVVLVLYLLAIPVYNFFNVQITSDYLPGMRSLLYHSSETYLSFFVAGDPLDNAWPSLHIGIPYAYFLLFLWTERSRGRTLADSPYRAYMWLVLVQLAVFAFSIVYLGVHWLLDIPGGLLIGYLGAMITEEIHEDVFGPLYRWSERASAQVSGWFENADPGSRS